MGDMPLSTEQVLGEVGCTAEGEAVGEEQKAVKTAQNMIDLNFPFEAIVSATQLDPEKVKALYQ